FPRTTMARKLDTLYLVYFLIHIPIILLVDIAPLYGRFSPTALVQLREWYVARYADRFFITPPFWFKVFTLFELVYHLPLSCWAVTQLWSRRNSGRFYLHLLVYAVQTTITTATCMVDMLAWEDFKGSTAALVALYLPYLVLPIVMAIDMFARLSAMLEGKGKEE
ncbi:hypothetical protein K470DRAFT_208393, partial [Piedraia hortae CBS 480.64]